MRTIFQIKEIFYSIQGEGFHAGEAAVFVRFAGCNLQCPFCDTDHKYGEPMTADDIVNEVCRISENCNLVIFTGGEPMLQLEQHLIDNLQDRQFEICVESNGTIKRKDLCFEWLTISPKNLYSGKETEVKICNEVKLVVTDQTTEDDIIHTYKSVNADWYYLQPCDTGVNEENKKIIQKTINLIKKYPQWKLSMRMQNVLNFK